MFVYGKFACSRKKMHSKEKVFFLGLMKHTPQIVIASLKRANVFLFVRLTIWLQSSFSRLQHCSDFFTVTLTVRRLWLHDLALVGVITVMQFLSVNRCNAEDSRNQSRDVSSKSTWQMNIALGVILHLYRGQTELAISQLFDKRERH